MAKHLIAIVAIAISLMGTAELSLAQTTRDKTAVTGSQANIQFHRQHGTYFGR
jgi:hypothetical protein